MAYMVVCIYGGIYYICGSVYSVVVPVIPVLIKHTVPVYTGIQCIQQQKMYTTLSY